MRSSSKSVSWVVMHKLRYQFALFKKRREILARGRFDGHRRVHYHRLSVGTHRSGEGAGPQELRIARGLGIVNGSSRQQDIAPGEVDKIDDDSDRYLPFCLGPLICW